MEVKTERQENDEGKTAVVIQNKRIKYGEE
jgi:hypothetical protein